MTFQLQTPASPTARKRRPHRYLIFLRNISFLALSSGLGGMFAGAISAIESHASATQYATNPDSLWELINFSVGSSGIIMTVLGFFVGLIVFACVEGVSARWSAYRKVRFTKALKRRLLFPLAASLTTVALMGATGWYLWQVVLTSNPYDSKGVGELACIIALPIASCILTVLLAHHSKRSHHKEHPNPERLLPLD